MIWDNGSTDGTREAIPGLIREGLLERQNVAFSAENLGCPRALSRILARRKPGQHFVKVDNDVVLQTKGWLGRLCAFLDEHPEMAIVSPWYRELESANQGRIIEKHDG